ncbi:hypothetical protein V8E55_008133 [Tylopilus felleus]
MPTHWQLQVAKRLQMEVKQCEKTARDRKATAAVQGPGKTTTDHHETDSISLMTPENPQKCVDTSHTAKDPIRQEIAQRGPESGPTRPVDRARTEATSEAASGEDLQTESGNNAHILKKAQCEMEHCDSGTSGRDDVAAHARAITAKMTNSTESKGHMGGVSKVHKDGGGPWNPHKPSDMLHKAGSIALERADTGVDGELVGMPHDVQDEVERLAMCRRVHDGNECGIEPNVLHRENGPRGQIGKEVKLENIQGVSCAENIWECIGYNGR